MNYTVVHNASQERYEIHVGGEVAGFTEAHQQEDGAILFNHTVVFDAFEGRGLASKLVAGAFDDLRKRGLKAVVTCPYILSWLPKHPDYEDVAAPLNG
jgi:predicted GNAT family acetyltransferase